MDDSPLVVALPDEIGGDLMPFFGISDDFAFHAKVIAAGNAAIGAYSRMGSFCMRAGRPGFLTEDEAKLMAKPAEIRALLQPPPGFEHGLIERQNRDGVKGYWIHDWQQPSPERLEEIRAARSAAGRKGGQRSGQSRRAQSEADAEANASLFASPDAPPDDQAETNHLSLIPNPYLSPTEESPESRGLGSGEGASPALPDAPAPKESRSKAKAKRGTRLPEGWLPKVETIDTIRREFPTLTSEDLERAHRVFRDHWAKVSGQRGVMLDWEACWRNWMRKEFDKPAYRRAPQGGPTADDKAAGWASL